MLSIGSTESCSALGTTAWALDWAQFSGLKLAWPQAAGKATRNRALHTCRKTCDIAGDGADYDDDHEDDDDNEDDDDDDDDDDGGNDDGDGHRG